MENRDDRRELAGDGVFEENLLAVGKSEYVTGDQKPRVSCILCSVRDDEYSVVSRKIYQDRIAFVTLNLYPFNPGHLMIVPCRHVERWRDLTDAETNAITALIGKSQDLLESELQCIGFNTGMNEGPASGASIAHLHVHVVPRFKNELGFIDTVGKTRAMIYTADEIHSRLRGKLEHGKKE